jgi:hypothetical protein
MDVRTSGGGDENGALVKPEGCKIFGDKRRFPLRSRVETG